MKKTLAELEQRFMDKFRKGEVKAFIIVVFLESSSDPVIALVHRARFGSEVLPIPAWLSQSGAEEYLQSHRDALQKDTVIEITHQNLQDMVENHHYDAFYPQAVSYHLDIQADVNELKETLSLE